MTLLVFFSYMLANARASASRDTNGCALIVFLPIALHVEMYLFVVKFQVDSQWIAPLFCVSFGKTLVLSSGAKELSTGGCPTSINY